MKEILRKILNLALFCMIAASLLVKTGHLAQARAPIEDQGSDSKDLKEVMPSAYEFEPQKKGNEVFYYQAFDKEHKQVGVVFKAYGQGYASVIETLAGMLNDGTITAIKVIGQNETPGLGARVAEPDFIGRFANKKIGELKDVQAIAGATISSCAVMTAVEAKAKEVKALLHNEK